MTETYQLCVNGTRQDVNDAWLGESLLYVLRERLGLPGSKSGCEQGECGSCSVLLDGELMCSCLVLAASAVGAEIVTVEGLGIHFGSPSQAPAHAGAAGKAAAPADEELTDVQRAFIDEGAVQCGFCTPGLIVAIHDLLGREPNPDTLSTREAISGNLCRCTGYGRIFAAVDSVVAARADGGNR